jgi:cytidyltransferase-like protein
MSIARKRIITDVTCQVFHYGHTRLFAEIKRRWPGSHLTVIVDSDELVHQLRGYLPVMTTAERVEMVSSNRHVDEVYCATLPFYPDSLIDAHDFFVRAGDPGLARASAMRAFYGRALDTDKMVNLDRTPGISSNELIQRCHEWWAKRQ